MQKKEMFPLGGTFCVDIQTSELCNSFASSFSARRPFATRNLTHICLKIRVNGDGDNDRRTPKFVNLNQIYTCHGGLLNEKYGGTSVVSTIAQIPISASFAS